jgi:hypothetical protein
MTRFVINRMNKKSQIQVEIVSLLNNLPELSDRIEVIERIGKKLRQANSLAISKEVETFKLKKGLKKDIDYTPVLPKTK